MAFDPKQETEESPADELFDEIYDFLYRDNDRFASFYAQLFEGRTSLVERGISTRDVKENISRGSSPTNPVLPTIAGETKTTSESTDSFKRIVDPHDMNNVFVLDHLRAVNRINEDVHNAPVGSLIIASGSLMFLNRDICELALYATQNVNIKRNQTERKDFDFGMKMMKQCLERGLFPPTFLMTMHDDKQIVGAIKESGLHEPIGAHYMKHGLTGMTDVHVIGIKEKQSEKMVLPPEQIAAAVHTIFGSIRSLFLPADAIRVTPLAIIRKIV